jgi:hypothetical protein
MIREHGKAETTFDALGKLCNFSSDTARRAVQDAVKYNVITVKKGEKLGVYIFTLNK